MATPISRGGCATVIFLTFSGVWAAAFWLWIIANPAQPVPGAGGGSLFLAFMTDWGGVLGCAFTIAAAAIVVFVPTALDRKVQELGESLQSKLHNFKEFRANALDLLESIEDDPESTFCMLAASPVLGVEHSTLTEKRVQTEKICVKFSNALLTRLRANGPRTELICLDHAALDRFCLALAKHLNGSRSGDDLAAEAREQIRDVCSMQTTNNATVQVTDANTAQIVIAQPGPGAGSPTALVFYSTEETLKTGALVGFKTTNPEQIDFVRRLFDGVRASARGPTRDTRTADQVKRDLELLAAMGTGRPASGEHMVALPGSERKLDVRFRGGVWPPATGLALESLLLGVAAAANDLWERGAVDVKHRVGIDVGTGSGILAAVLALHAGRIFASDLMPDAVESAQENLARLKSQEGLDFEFQALESDLLDSVPAPHEDDVVLIVFNHPFYPSPHNLGGAGGLRAGSVLIREFLETAKKFVGLRGGIIMPRCELAGAEHDPVTIARSLGYFVSRLAGPIGEGSRKCEAFLFRLEPPPRA